MTQKDQDEYRYCHATGKLLALFELLATAARTEAATALRAKVADYCAKARDIDHELKQAEQRIINRSSAAILDTEAKP